MRLSLLLNWLGSTRSQCQSSLVVCLTSSTCWRRICTAAEKKVETHRSGCGIVSHPFVRTRQKAPRPGWNLWRASSLSTFCTDCLLGRAGERKFLARCQAAVASKWARIECRMAGLQLTAQLCSSSLKRLKCWSLLGRDRSTATGSSQARQRPCVPTCRQTDSLSL